MFGGGNPSIFAWQVWCRHDQKVQESGIAPDKDRRNPKPADNPDTGLLRGSGWGLTDWNQESSDREWQNKSWNI